MKRIIALLLLPIVPAAFALSPIIGGGGGTTSPGGSSGDIQTNSSGSFGGLTPGTGVATALAVNVGSAGAPVLFNGAGGTPTSLTGTNISGTAASLTAGHVTTNANLTGDVTSVGNASTLASIPAIAGTNLTGTAASLTAGNATKWTTGRTIALTGDVTYTSGSLDGSGNVTGTATLANIPAIAGTNLTGTANGLTAGDVTRNHAVYAGASPPTVDVGVFTVSKTSVDLKTAASTSIFTVPTSRAFVAISAQAVVTAVTAGGAGTETFKITESGASGNMTAAGASGSSTPVAGTWYGTNSSATAGPYTQCAAGNNVQVTVSTSQAGSTAVTGTVYVTGFYTQ